MTSSEKYQSHVFYGMIGMSDSMLSLFKRIEKYAPTDAPVVITGETGTGKELIARNIYQESDRSNKQFISVNCASIPENLFESEFFGYKKGAFTGAYKEKPGYFEMANYGILHLDEIGEMPIEFQAKLLRVLEQGSFIKLGGTKEIHVNVRIIASTNKNLKEEVDNKRFREDLYFRIAVFTIYVPPLRERKEDIPIIADHIWKNLNLKMGQKINSPLFSLEELKNYVWKGNIRELRNHLEKKLIYLSMGQDYQPEVISNKEFNRSEKEITPIDEYICNYVVDVFKYYNYNKTQTAKALGMSLSTLKRKLKIWGIRVTKGMVSSSE